MEAALDGFVINSRCLAFSIELSYLFSKKALKGSGFSMSETWYKILELLEHGHIHISEHGYDELAADGISVREIMAGYLNAKVLEDYPSYPKGPCVLTMQKDKRGHPIHVVWGIPHGSIYPAVLVTAYRPDPDQWEAGSIRRKK